MRVKTKFDTITRLCAFALLLTFLTLTSKSIAQVSSRSTAAQTLHCIRDGNWLTPPLSEQTQWQVSYSRDLKSYPGEETLVVVVFSGNQAGQVFHFQRERIGKKISL